MKLLLQHKIVAGYLLLMAVIGCMVAIVLHERKRVSEIEQESITIFQTQSNISTTHRHITVLATFGESVMTWTGKDCKLYRTRRLKADSLLQILREQCKEFVRPEQVDSLRSLLLNKEEHLLRMKEIFRQQKQIDSLLGRPIFTCHITSKYLPYCHPQEKRDSRIIRRQGNRTIAIR